MKKDNMFRVGMAVAALTLTTLIVAGVSNAQSVKPSDEALNNGNGFFRQRMMPKSTNHDTAMTALAAKDYEAWKSAAPECPMAKNVTADNFLRFAEAHQLMQAGKSDEAKVIFDELGIERRGGQKMGAGRGMRANGCSQNQTQTPRVNQ